jgi:O-antigen ligase
VALFSVGRLRPVNMLILTILFFGGLAVVQMAPGAWDVIGQQISRGGNVDSAMSGRTHIWSESLRLFAERPLMGYGYATTRVLFLEQFDVESIKGEAPPNAHNMLVQSLVTTGLVGTIFLLIAVIVPLVHSLRHREGLANPLIWYLTIVGLAGLGPIGATPGSVTIFWLLSLFMVHFATTGDSGSEGRIAAHHAGRYVQVRAGLGAKS